MFPGLSPLHFHCARGRVYGVAALLFHGADVNFKAQPVPSSPENKTPILSLTPIELATRHNHTEVVRILLAYGASPLPIETVNNNMNGNNFSSKTT